VWHPPWCDIALCQEKERERDFLAPGCWHSTCWQASHHCPLVALCVAAQPPPPGPLPWSQTKLAQSVICIDGSPVESTGHESNTAWCMAWQATNICWPMGAHIFTLSFRFPRGESFVFRIIINELSHNNRHLFQKPEIIICRDIMSEEMPKTSPFVPAFAYPFLRVSFVFSRLLCFYN